MLILLSVMVLGVLYAASLPLKVYVDGKPEALEVVSVNGKACIPVRELAKTFPGRFVLNTEKNTLSIYTQKVGEKTSGRKGFIHGKISLGANRPLVGVPVMLFIDNPKITEENALSLFKEYSSGKDNSYVRLHGKVREGRTGGNGKYDLIRVPPGKYELTAVFGGWNGEPGCFWRKKLIIGKQKEVRVDFGPGEAFKFSRVSN